MIRATIKLMLDGKPMANGEHAVYLRILKDRKQKKISLGLYCKKAHFVNEAFTKHHPNYQTENQMLLKLKARALEIIRVFKLNQQDFNLNEFEEEFRTTKREKEVSVMDFFDEIIDEKTRAGNISTAGTYKDTRDSIIKFKGKDIKFSSITVEFLEKYELFLRERGSKGGGVKFKMRTLKALYNKARKRKIIPKEPYPFEDYKFSKYKSEARKIALTVEEFKKIKNIDISEHPLLLEAYNYFMFSVYCRGMNFHDMMLLKWSDIRNNRIYYTRSKTKRQINLEIIEPVQHILDFYKAQNRPTDCKQEA